MGIFQDFHVTIPRAGIVGTHRSNYGSVRAAEISINWINMG